VRHPIVLGLVAVGPGALAVSGDDGPARPSRAGRPTRTVLRAADVELAPARSAVWSDRRVLLLVSGIGSAATDPTFDALIRGFAGDPGYEIHRFGADPAHPYDTLGRLADNADALTAEVRELARTHPGVDIVAHSMGGAVVDTALARGLSSADRVGTYVSLASPHDGSTEARLGVGVLGVATGLGLAPELRAVSAGVAQDVGAPAVRDLAQLRAADRPAGITRLDVRLATDLVITSPDARAPGVPSRVLLPSALSSLDGHGGVTTDPRALALVAETVRMARVPEPDLRTRLLDPIGAALALAVAATAPYLYAALAVALCCAAGALALRRRRPWARPTGARR
jgi:hypothetical protein